MLPNLSNNHYNDHLVTYFVNSDWLAIDFDHVHDFDGIISILLSKELNKPIALMQLRDAIFWHMHINWKKINPII